MDWPRIMGAVLLLYGVYVIYKGRITSAGENTASSYTITRSGQPVRYWFSVILILGGAVLMLLHIINF